MAPGLFFAALKDADANVLAERIGEDYYTIKQEDITDVNDYERFLACVN